MTTDTRSTYIFLGKFDVDIIMVRTICCGIVCQTMFQHCPSNYHLLLKKKMVCQNSGLFIQYILPVASTLTDCSVRHNPTYNNMHASV